MNYCGSNDYDDPHEKALYSGDPKVAVYDAEDILPLLRNFPHLADHLRGMTVYFHGRFFYLIRADVWEKGGPELLGIVFNGGDPRCDKYRMSQLTDVGSFEPALNPPVSSRTFSADPEVPCSQ